MKEIINTVEAPAPIGPYNQSVKAGGTLYVSGQIPLSPETGQLVNGSIKEETQRVLENIKAILHAADYAFEDVVKSSIFLTDMANFADVNDVYGTYFVQDTPARECVAVAGLPKDVRVEISVIAHKA